MFLITIFINVAALVCATPAAAADPDPVDWQRSAQSIIGALDYVAIDYPLAVNKGAVVDSAEYAEQREFLTTVSTLLQSLPPRPARAKLLEEAATLSALVDQRAEASAVAAASHDLVAGLIAAYDVLTAPRIVPTPGAMGSRYAELCAGCHGSTGHGDGPMAAGLNPAPTDFLDAERARQRSLFGLYSTITLGVQGSAMPSFARLSESERWSLAFYVAGLRDEPSLISKGEQYWQQGNLNEALPSLASLTSTAPSSITKNSSNEEAAEAVLAFLRHRPEALMAGSSNPIQRSIQGLEEAVSAYRSGRQEIALQLALSAYLEGYELIEAPLRILDDELAIDIERDMQRVRNMIRGGVAAEQLDSTASTLYSKLNRASILLTEKGSSSVTLFTSALLILLREGLEAILLLAAMSLYLRRTGHSSALRYLHLGWASALATGALTWIAVKTIIDIGGAQREVVEGAAALLASAVLLYVGIWLHRNSSTAQWQAFLNERLGRSMSTGTLWGITALSFVAVYREVLETVLFYETLWLQSGSATPLVSGALVAVIGLIAIVWVVFRIGARLPLRLFFQANSALMFVLAFIFAGKGVAALQEAGWVAATFIDIPRIEWLGIYPTAQTIGVQLSLCTIGGFWLLLQLRRKKPGKE